MNTKNKALLAYVIIFLIGGASGFFLNEALRPQLPERGFEQGQRWNNGFPGPGDERRGERMRQRMGNYLTRELDLEEDQAEPFLNILDEHLEKLYSGIREYRSEEIDMIRGLYSQFVDDAKEILTDQQLQELNRIAHPDSVKKKRMQRRKQGDSR